VGNGIRDVIVGANAAAGADMSPRGDLPAIIRRREDAPVAEPRARRTSPARAAEVIRLHRAPQRPVPRRVAMLSLHTSPVEQPGTGDAGGMNVYVGEVARRLAALGVEVDVFTRATSGDLPPVEQVAPGYVVRNVIAGPLEPLPKQELPTQLCAFTAAVLRAEAAREPGWYDLVHSHYWLSGQVGWLAKERWGIPLVHTMHTMARVKNLALADGDLPEPSARAIGEAQVVEAADRLIANTSAEAAQLAELYDADPDAVSVVAPGVDLDVYRPGSRAEARRLLGLPADRTILLFVGRIQPLKAPDLVVRVLAHLVEHEPHLRDRLLAVVVGGPSGPGGDELARLHDLARRLGVHDLVRFQPPVPPGRLADFYRAADVTLVPSYSESFGLVALESQACGTPVVAARVGGLVTAVDSDRSGALIDGHDAAAYAAAVMRLTRDPAMIARRSAWAREHATGFGWDRTVAGVLDVYAEALLEREELRRRSTAVSG
jgi:D-inositol-3-phosphate glycosyltransferase